MTPKSVDDGSVDLIRSAVSDRVWTAGELIAEIASVEPLEPFAPQATEFCAELSRRLFEAGRGQDPAVVALAYWLRPANVERARASFAARIDERTLRVPRGVVFHVTPANVDTMFVYSWVLAMLVGNRNVVRLSERSTTVMEQLLAAVGRTLEDSRFAGIRERNVFVWTGHDDQISRALSSVADLRVIWGGDATVEHFRTFALPPRGRDLPFPDRHSFAILDVRAVCAADEPALDRIGEQFFNDAFWFDQAACSSPRLVIWRSGEASEDEIERARTRFKTAVESVVRRRGYRVETGTAIEKMVFGFRAAAEGRAARLEASSNEVAWAEVLELDDYERQNCGGGMFFEYVSRDLARDLATFVSRRDQTAACLGLSGDETRDLARVLNGRGVDRWVPLGLALEFSGVWDGHDLLDEFSRRVTVGL